MHFEFNPSNNIFICCHPSWVTVFSYIPGPLFLVPTCRGNDYFKPVAEWSFIEMGSCFMWRSGRLLLLNGLWEVVKQKKKKIIFTYLCSTGFSAVHKNLTNTEKLSLLHHNFWQPAVLKLEIWFSSAAMVEIWVSVMNPTSASVQPQLSYWPYNSCLYISPVSSVSIPPQWHKKLAHHRSNCEHLQHLLVLPQIDSDGFLFTSQLWHHQLFYITHR